MLHLILASMLADGWASDRLKLTDRLNAAIATFERVRPQLQHRLGTEQTVDIGSRLVDDERSLLDPTPDGYGEDAWHETMQTITALDLETIDRAARDTTPQLPTAPGLHEGFVQSTIDDVWEPVAVYVPAHHTLHPPLAVVLHGRPQSETELLGQPFLRALADRTGTILVAPWGRGIYDFAEPAQTDLDRLVPIVQQTYAADPRATFLVGYSMGGFSVFKVGTKRAWSGIMCIAGALLNSEVAAVRFAWRDTPVYVINGSADESIPAEYGMLTAIYLDGLGVPTSFYQQPGGHHWVRSLMPKLTQAWDDMHHGTVRADTIPRGAHVAGGFMPNAPALHDAEFKP